MYNWSTDISELKKRLSKDEFEIWKLEQLINFGLNGEKINESKLRKYWDRLNLDPWRKKALEIMLWPNRDYLNN